MGILNSIAVGLGAAGKAAQPFIANMQEAEIQKLRDERLAEITKTAAREGTDYKIQAEEAAAERGRKRITEAMSPETPSENKFSGVLGKKMNDNLAPADMVGADENIGVDVQARDRPATIAEKAGRLVNAGYIKEGGDLAKMDDKEAQLANTLKIAELNAAIKSEKVSNEMKLGMAKLEAYLVSGVKSGQAPTEERQIKYLMENGETFQNAKNIVYRVDPKVGEYQSVTTESMENGKKVSRTTKEKIKSGDNAAAENSATPKTPAVTPAPQAALDYLSKNPSQSAAFKQKYGYLPGAK